MKILALETSTLTGSVALLDVCVGPEKSQKIVGEMTLSVSVQHSERLLPMVDQLLNQCSCKIQDVHLFAVSVGPGSFTGLRIGIAAAQGFALAHSKPVLGVSSLQVLAMNGFGFSGVVLPVVNAFRGEVYTGLYQQCADGLKIVGSECAVSPEVLKEEILKTDTTFFVLGNGVDIVKPSFESLGQGKVVYAPSVLHVPRAAHVGMLAYEKFEKGVLEEVVVPNYLRVPG